MREGEDVVAINELFIYSLLEVKRAMKRGGNTVTRKKLIKFHHKSLMFLFLAMKRRCKKVIMRFFAACILRAKIERLNEEIFDVTSNGWGIKKM